MAGYLRTVGLGAKEQRGHKLFEARVSRRYNVGGGGGGDDDTRCGEQ